MNTTLYAIVGKRNDFSISSIVLSVNAGPDFVEEHRALSAVGRQARAQRSMQRSVAVRQWLPDFAFRKVESMAKIFVSLGTP